MKEKVLVVLEAYGKISSVFLSAIILLISVATIVSVSLPKKLRVSFLDIGQGDAIFIQTPGNHNMLIDGGPTSKVVSELGKKMNHFDRHLDVMIATHGDADHITGLIPVLEKFSVSTIVRSPIDASTDTFNDLRLHIEDEDADIHVGYQGDVIDFGDGVVAHILYPKKNISLKTETNDASVSVVISYGNQSFLLTGDLSSRFEPQLIGADLPKHVTVYKAGHHGSKTSSGVPLLSYIKPEYAIISAGKDNRYGHPNPEALARLEQYSQEILSTIDRGTVTFVSDGRTLKIESDK